MHCVDFMKWYEILVCKVGNVVKQEDVVEAEGTSRQRATVSQMEGIAWHYVQAW